MKQLCLLLGSVIVLALSFGAIYQLPLLSQFSLWQKVAAINGLLALLVFFIRSMRPVEPLDSITLGARRFSWKVLLLPSSVIFAGALILALASALAGDAVREPVGPEFLLIIFVIPFIEEIVFRVGLGSYFQKLAPGLWGAYFSALLFAWVHSAPTPQQLASFEMGIPLGPFFLGLCCEYMYLKSKRLLPIYLFHMVCNGTVLIFRILDARWLDWLRWFYL